MDGMGGLWVTDSFIDIRMPDPLERFYKNLFDSNREYAWNEDLIRLRKMLPKMSVCSFFYAFELRKNWKV